MRRIDLTDYTHTYRDVESVACPKCGAVVEVSDPRVSVRRSVTVDMVTELVEIMFHRANKLKGKSYRKAIKIADSIEQAGASVTFSKKDYQCVKNSFDVPSLSRRYGEMGRRVYQVDTETYELDLTDYEFSFRALEPILCPRCGEDMISNPSGETVSVERTVDVRFWLPLILFHPRHTLKGRDYVDAYSLSQKIELCEESYIDVEEHEWDMLRKAFDDAEGLGRDMGTIINRIDEAPKVTANGEIEVATAADEAEALPEDDEPQETEEQQQDVPRP